LRSVEAVLALGVAGVEEREAWCRRFGDCWNGSVLCTADDGERRNGKKNLEAHV
jgi:hypothetical protein